MSYGQSSELLKNIGKETKSEKNKSESMLYDDILNGSKILKKRAVEKIGRLYASESGHCARKGTLSALDSDDTLMKPTFLYYTEIGKTVENALIQSLITSNVLLFPNKDNITEQFNIPDVGLNLGGKLDGIIYKNGKISLLEIKTAGQKMPNDPAKEKPQHLAQARIYSALLGTDINLLYFARNVSSDMHGESLKIREFYYKFDRGAVYDTIFSACLSSYSVTNGYIPPIPETINFQNKADMCSYCNFFSYCWSDNKKEINLKTPNEQENKIMREFAHNKTGEILNPKNIKIRHENFIDDIIKVGNKDLVNSLTFMRK